jgi:hypothetical protein
MREVLGWVLIVASLACVVVSGFSSFMMLAHLSGDKNEPLRLFFLGVMAPDDLFTPVGLRHRNRAIVTGLVGFGCFLVWFFFLKQPPPN